MMWFGWYCVIGFLIIVFTRKTFANEIIDKVYERMPASVEYASVYMFGACMVAIGWLPLILYMCWFAWKYEEEDEEEWE